MACENILSEESLALAESLVENIKNKNSEKANQILEQMNQKDDSVLLQEIGKLTRDLHTALNGFNLDSQLSNLAEEDFSDARERLHYVISLTDQAANTTLSSVEEAVPLCDQLHSRVKEIKASWDKFLSRDMCAEEFRKFSRQLESYLQDWEGDVVSIKQRLNEILLAQDFQDLTGQVLHRVIELVENLETNLVGLIKVAGKKGNYASNQNNKPDIEAAGPKVPGVDKWATVSGQDEVDDLLSSLGF
ncbi:MAG TPA: protein phosphatase CheZ [Gammaproteobacteria bacterium]|nr:protein phosphatase CheZ [Gammaproteobacteria bacterium]